jgi:hypothetical protein
MPDVRNSGKIVERDIGGITTNPSHKTIATAMVSAAAFGELLARYP